MAKIIGACNFCKDNTPDILIAENVNKLYAIDFKDFMNMRYSGPDAPYFFKVVEDDYVLKEVD